MQSLLERLEQDLVLPTKHRDKLATLMTHNFQTWGEVSLLNA